MPSRLSGLLLRTLQGEGSRIATRHHDRQRTWAEFGHRVRRLAAGLVQAGLKPGDRVALLAANSDRYLELMFAISWAGGVLQPTNLRLAAAEVGGQLSDSGAAILVYDDAGQDLAQGSTNRSVIADVYIGEGHCPGHAVSYENLSSSAPSEAPSERQGQDLAMLLYTGGTTGRAKGVMLSHRNLVMQAVSTAPVLNDHRDDVILHLMPMFHVAGTATAIRATMVGCANVFLPRFDPLLWLETVSRERVTRSAMAPTMLKSAIEHERFSDFDLSSLKRLLYGAAPITEIVLRAALQRLSHVDLYQGYGMTESTSAVVFLAPSYHVLEGPQAKRLRSAGRIVPGSELRIAGPDGGEMSTGETGEICVKGDTVMLGYWNRPEETAKTLVEGWLRTGDAGHLDEEGFVYIVDRVKDMIVSGGENVYSAEVENALARHPDVIECAVIGIPHPHWGEQVHAIVRLRPGSTAAATELMKSCRDLIAGYKCPKTIELRSDPLPLSAAGKVLKTELRRPYWKDEKRSIA